MVKLHVCVGVYTMHPFVVMSCATIAMEIVIVRIK